MTTKAYRRMILEGTRDLPNDALAEIVDFVFFLRKRTFDRESFDREMQGVLLQAELSELGRSEEEHLEREFENYDQEFPRE